MKLSPLGEARLAERVGPPSNTAAFAAGTTVAAAAFHALPPEISVTGEAAATTAPPLFASRCHSPRRLQRQLGRYPLLPPPSCASTAAAAAAAVARGGLRVAGAEATRCATVRRTHYGPRSAAAAPHAVVGRGALLAAGRVLGGNDVGGGT